MKILLPLIFASAVIAQTTNSDLCTQKKKQYGTKFLSCSEVDWGVKPLSADYQPTNFGPMTAKPSQSRISKENGKDIEVKYENDYPGIKNTTFYHSETDTPLASKFYSVVSSDKKTTTEDPTLANWLATDWYNSLQPNTQASGWTGKCNTWSAWSMDPEIQKLFSGIRDGILCNGIPFSRGELKEIITALYPEPSMDRKDCSQFYSGYYGENHDSVEDANVALSKLGVMGQSDVGPAQVIALAQNAKLSGKNMIMDRDPGSEIWNQPIQKITDVSYSDENVNEWETLSSAEFVTTANSPSQIKFLSDLATVESELTQSLLRGNGVSNSRICTLRKELGETCDDLAVQISKSAQVDALNNLKKSAFNLKLIQTKQAVSIVKHEMIIEYGTESNFASNAQDKTIVQSYTYASVNSVNPDGSDGPAIRSQWSPRVNSLAEICASPTLAEGRNSTVMTRGFDVNQKCSQGKPVNSSLAENDYFTGAIPPQTFKTFNAKPVFSTAQAQQQKAYEKLLSFMATCEKFDAGVDFLKHLDQVVLNNVISAQESADLAKEYQNVKKLLDANFIKSLLDNKYQGVQGVRELKMALFPS